MSIENKKYNSLDEDLNEVRRILKKCIEEDSTALEEKGIDITTFSIEEKKKIQYEEAKELLKPVKCTKVKDV